MKYPKVMYPCTNEFIPAIMSGLSPKSNDVVVSIGGSGDFAFAIAPRVKQVYAVDANKYQVAFMEEQSEFIRNGKFEDFCRMSLIAKHHEIYHQSGNSPDELGDVAIGHMLSRKDYFSGNVFSNCRNAIDRVKIVHCSISEFLGKFYKVDKVYSPLGVIPRSLLRHL